MTGHEHDENDDARRSGPLRRYLFVWAPVVASAVSYVLFVTDMISFPFRLAEFSDKANVAELVSKAASCRTDAYPHVMLDEKDKARAAFACIHENLARAIEQGDTLSFAAFASIYDDQAFGDAVVELTPADAVRTAGQAWCNARRKGISEAMSDPPFTPFDC